MNSGKERKDKQIKNKLEEDRICTFIPDNVRDVM
jgi:hypothetical protein